MFSNSSSVFKIHAYTPWYIFFVCDGVKVQFLLITYLYRLLDSISNISNINYNEFCVLCEVLMNHLE